ncbi:acyltransferase family protein [Streptococcus thermophilus]|nr:acyltransferase family protein [Streptococcus thermophilus]MCE2207152.1 acyltransferase family protein [Streptococcus thermophilus]MCE2325574.1 acyltransferase family protein [Streptococcus thermophilus]MCE2328254.1 acyltransferase family protein [Streptococcus thermophilus]MCE2332960.1 acyltransferase family protein [Streptococcus thermophilus]
MQKKDVVVGIQSNRVVAIDYLKGFSIFTIVLMHLLNTMSAIPSKIQTLASIGGAGVHVFFLCSGIGLYLSYLKRKTNYYDFLRKRFTKIYIPYIIIVFISFLLILSIIMCKHSSRVEEC